MYGYYRTTLACGYTTSEMSPIARLYHYQFMKSSFTEKLFTPKRSIIFLLLIAIQPLSYRNLIKGGVEVV